MDIPDDLARAFYEVLRVRFEEPAAAAIPDPEAVARAARAEEILQRPIIELVPNKPPWGRIYAVFEYASKRDRPVRTTEDLCRRTERSFRMKNCGPGTIVRIKKEVLAPLGLRFGMTDADIRAFREGRFRLED